MIILFIIIFILYIKLYINSSELFKNYNYQGPIIFLQKTETLNGLDEFIEIGKHPNEDYYPTDEQLQYLNYPNIIKIPKGKKGDTGLNGSPGTNQGNTYRKLNNDITKISSSDILNIYSKNNMINFNNGTNSIKLSENSDICIKENCIKRKDIDDIIEVYK
tara:strand:+ start:878 stop:1360 length:483 start_codon:yes stop_codon:yes gene_type:complete